VKVKRELFTVHAIKAYRQNGGTTPPIFNLGTVRMWVVSFTPRPLYSREKIPGLEKEDGGGAMSPPGRFRRREKSIAPTGIQTTDRPVTMPKTQTLLCYVQ
jgi:hypothetical protein